MPTCLDTYILTYLRTYLQTYLPTLPTYPHTPRGGDPRPGDRRRRPPASSAPALRARLQFRAGAFFILQTKQRLILLSKSVDFRNLWFPKDCGCFGTFPTVSRRLRRCSCDFPVCSSISPAFSAISRHIACISLIC